MSRQYFGDVLSEPINAAFATITATAETVLIPTAYTPIPAYEPDAGKVYELVVGGTITTGTTPTMIITPRLGVTITGTILGVSPTQTMVSAITTAPFLYRCYLIFRTIGLAGANSTAVCSGVWTSGGAVATASSGSQVNHCTTGAAIAVDTTIANGLWIGITSSAAPSIIPQWHVWRSLN